MKKLIALSILLTTLVGFSSFAQDAPTNAINPTYKADWRWVHGAVFVPTSAINEAQQWDEYDPVINDRELHYASFYGINCVRVYLHYFIYLKKKDALLHNIEDFLTRADKYGIKVEFVFFDDCWNEPSKNILKADYHYPEPVFGVHNSRWLLSPGHEILAHYNDNRDSLKAYVQDIVKAHLDDKRIAFWETYNEPHKGTPGLLSLIKDAQIWIHETGSKIPVTATGAEFCGDPYSDFLSWHNYTPDYKISGDLVHALNTECMCRKEQSIPGIVEHFMGKTGFMVWEFGIGRDDCRFYWGETAETPAPDEHDKPFHGIIFADGHPWSTYDVQAWLGADKFARLPVFHVTYFRDTEFKRSAKESITPFIDYELRDEVGYGSPDTSVHLGKDYYSIRWTGEIESPKPGITSLIVKSDGSVKVKIDGRMIIEKAKGPDPASGDFKLKPGRPAKIVVEYIHETGPASVHLNWLAQDGSQHVLLPLSHP